MKKRQDDTSTNADIHEKDVEYLHRSLYTARKAADYFGWVSIPWADNGIEREIEEKNDEIYRLVRTCIDL